MAYWFSVLSLSLGLLVSGCTTRYVILTKQDQVIVTKTKPTIDTETGLIQYVDEAGNIIEANSNEIARILIR